MKCKEESYRPSMLQVFLLCLKIATPKPSKVATAKNFFSSVYVLVMTCFDKCFFFLHVITERHCFYKSLLIPLGLFNCHVVVLLEARNLKEVDILLSRQ